MTKAICNEKQLCSNAELVSCNCQCVNMFSSSLLRIWLVRIYTSGLFTHLNNYANTLQNKALQVWIFAFKEECESLSATRLQMTKAICNEKQLCSNAELVSCNCQCVNMFSSSLLRIWLVRIYTSGLFTHLNNYANTLQNKALQVWIFAFKEECESLSATRLQKKRTEWCFLRQSWSFWP